MARPPPPSNCGRRLLPVVIDEVARDEPRRPFASLPIDDWDLSKGYEDISYAEFANAVNKLAWFVKDAVGTSTNFASIAYLGVPDLRYHMLQMAVCKTGHKVLFSSQLNSLSVHLDLMEQTECIALLSAAGVRVDDVLAARHMPHAVVPDLDTLLDLSHVAPIFPYTKTFAQAAQDPYMILHGAGTGGEVRPVVYNHALIAAIDSQLLLPDVGNRKHCSTVTHPGLGTRFLVLAPPFHAMSAGLAMCMSVLGGGVFVPGLRHRALSLSDLYGVFDHASATHGTFAAKALEYIARQEDGIKYIKRFEMVYVGGELLSPYATGVWAKHTRIQNVWGSTETMNPPQLEADDGDATYVYFDPEHSGVEMRPVDIDFINTDGAAAQLFELVLTLTPQSAPYATWHAREGYTLDNGINGTGRYPEFRTGDLWTPHPDPEKSGYAWRFSGRADDMLTLAAGVHLHPATIERAITAHPLACAALMIGTGHRRPLVLVEIVDDGGACEEETVVSRLWEEAIKPTNDHAAEQGRVARSHIVLVPASNGFIRTVKGSIVRRATERKFADRIEDVYARFGDQWDNGAARYSSILQTTHISIEVSVAGSDGST